MLFKKLKYHLSELLESGTKRSFNTLPELNLRLLLAAISTFLPSILMSPFGAEMEIPVNALTSTLPKDDWMVTERESDDMDIS